MGQKDLAGVTIDIDDNGYMKNLDQWNKEIAQAFAKENGIEELTPKHWDVIEYIQKNVKDEVVISIRKIGKSGIVDIKTFYDLFPDGPLKKATLIAGVLKPSGCV